MKQKASSPFSLRLPSRLDVRITAIAKRTRRSKAYVLASLADEGERCRRYVGLAFRGGEDYGRRAWVVGTGLDVWEMISMLQDYDNDVERLSREHDLSEQKIRLAVAYHREFPEEIDETIAENRRPIEEVLRDFPFIEHPTVSR